MSHPGRFWHDGPLPDLRRCRHCGLDTIEAARIKPHEDNCTDNPDNEEEPLDPEGDRGPNYLPDPDLDPTYSNEIDPDE